MKELGKLFLLNERYLAKHRFAHYASYYRSRVMFNFLLRRSAFLPRAGSFTFLFFFFTVGNRAS